MEKKYYNVRYVNGDSDQKEGVAFYTKYFEYSRYHYMVAGYDTEVYYENKKIEKLFGTKEIKERKERRVVGEIFITYVEEVDGKYYDVVTGIEVVKSNFFSYKENISDYAQSYNAGLDDKFIAELKKGMLWFSATGIQEVNVGSVYNFLKAITESNRIELYYKKFYEALENAKKFNNEMLAKISETKNKQVMQEEYISKFRENNGFGRNRTR